MSRSVSYSVVGSILATIVFLVLIPAPWSSQEVIAVAIAGFNVVALAMLLWLFFRLEKSTNAEFGKAVRENVGTIVPAILISIIYTAYSLADSFKL